jgi:hypothetical protein
MSTPLIIECEVHFQRETRGRKGLREGAAPPRVATPGRIPRVSKLLALALRFDGLLRDGAVKDYSDLARLGHVTRARISQIMSLVLLAPDIQEAVLFLSPTRQGRDPIQLRHLLPIAAIPDWCRQRKIWAGLTASARSRAEEGVPPIGLV